MCSSSREEVGAVLDRVDTAVEELLSLGFEALTTPERFTVLERIETVARRLPVPGHELINELGRHASREELGGRLSHALAERLHITRAEASRRIGEAADLGPRRALTGQPLPPALAATAAGQRSGDLGAGHVAVIRGFLHRLPGFVDAATRERAEAHLAREAAKFRPDQAAALAETLTDCLNPDGTYTDDDRARRRTLMLGKQQPDGMSRLHGYIDPQLRATLEAVWAKLAAPGMANPESPTPIIDGTPSRDAIDHDTRTAGQRHHDALTAALRALLASGDLGQHNGLPASIIVSTTLGELEAAAGRGLTGGGTLLPMSDVIRLARHAHHYLAIFHNGKAIALYHTRRLASPGQRIVLYAKDHGCSAPGCDVSGYYCEVHHCTPYAHCHTTDINDLTFGCGSHHPLAEQGYITRKNTHGDTEWIPPDHLDHGQPRVNTFHHPEKLLRDNNTDDDDEDDEDDDGPDADSGPDSGPGSGAGP